MTVDKTDFDVREFLLVVKTKEIKLAKFKYHERYLININFIPLSAGNMVLLLFI